MSGTRARGQCAICRLLVVQTNAGTAARHLAPPGAALDEVTTEGRCLGGGMLTFEAIERVKQREIERTRVIPDDLPFERALECAACGHRAWRPELHYAIHAVVCVGSPDQPRLMGGRSHPVMGDFAEVHGFWPFNDPPPRESRRLLLYLADTWDPTWDVQTWPSSAP